MQNTYSLSTNDSATEVSISTAGTVICDAITDLDGMTGATIQVNFVYGANGTSGKVFIQTSLDQGNTWIDIACITFAQVNKKVAFTLIRGQVGITVPSDKALTDDTVLQGILGDRLRAAVVTTGTAYTSNTTLSLRAVVS